MILVAFILYDVYAVYATLFPQVLKMHGSCLPTQLFVLLLKASESSEKEASKLRDAKSCREKRDVRGGPPSHEDAGDMLRFLENSVMEKSIALFGTHLWLPPNMLNHTIDTFVQKVMAGLLLNYSQFWRRPRLEIEPHTVYSLHVHKQRSMKVISPHPTPCVT